MNPRKAHANALKKIGQYLRGVLKEGLIIDPCGKLTLDCYVDADFAGNFTIQEGTDATSVRSRTGFLITLGTVPVLWKSTIQALSTMESEYIALSTAMRKLIQL